MEQAVVQEPALVRDGRGAAEDDGQGEREKGRAERVSLLNARRRRDAGTAFPVE